MKQLTCEMCGGTDLMKQDGAFVCQNCGMKYSVEEAKKMMIEGTVDVQGTVKVDNTAFVERYLQNARRAKQKEDWEETEKYYNMVEQNEPTNIEAIFYSSYGKAKASLVDGDLYKRQAAFKVYRAAVQEDHRLYYAFALHNCHGARSSYDNGIYRRRCFPGRKRNFEHSPS